MHGGSVQRDGVGCFHADFSEGWNWKKNSMAQLSFIMDLEALYHCDKPLGG
jgi:hypothetical protein